MGHVDGGGSDAPMQLKKILPGIRPKLGVQVGQGLIQQENIRRPAKGDSGPQEGGSAGNQRDLEIIPGRIGRDIVRLDHNPKTVSDPGLLDDGDLPAALQLPESNAHRPLRRPEPIELQNGGVAPAVEAFPLAERPLGIPGFAVYERRQISVLPPPGRNPLQMADPQNPPPKREPAPAVDEASDSKGPDGNTRLRAAFGGRLRMRRRQADQSRQTHPKNRTMKKPSAARDNHGSDPDDGSLPEHR